MTAPIPTLASWQSFPNGSTAEVTVGRRCYFPRVEFLIVGDFRMFRFLSQLVFSYVISPPPAKRPFTDARDFCISPLSQLFFSCIIEKVLFVCQADRIHGDFQSCVVISRLWVPYAWSVPGMHCASPLKTALSYKRRELLISNCNGPSVTSIVFRKRLLFFLSWVRG